MNKLIILGNLTHDPILNTTASGIPVCNFSVAVNRRSGQQEITDYFRVTAWRQKAESCAKYLHTGSRVCCWGAVTATTYQAQDGSTRVSLELNADEVEFCGGSRRQQTQEPAQAPEPAQTQDGMTVVDSEDLPF